MTKIFLVLAGIVFFSTTAFASGEPDPAGYSLNPSLLADCIRTTETTNISPLRLKADDNSAAVQLVTRTPFSPYLGASRHAEPEDEGSPSIYHSPEKDGSPLADYRLEAGIGCQLDDNANLNVGYRFTEPLGDPTPAALEARADDLRISLDIKLPF